MTCDFIANKALEIAQKYGSDPFEAAIAAGAHISFKDLGSLKGAYFGNMPKPTIAINCTIDDRTQKIVCAHELGHHILHQNNIISCENIDFKTATNTGILEREANIFAATYLVDIKKAKELLKSGYTTFECASILETNVDLLLFLLNTNGICDAPDSEFLK